MTKARTLANLISDNAELADGQISVAEVVGAAPTANPTFTGTASGTFSGPLTGNVTGNLTGDVTGAVTGDVTAPEIDLTAIAKDISDTAVDVFVYDTRKDSDGGAWRKRTQGTSWYNEPLNTATRGSRKEFPAVAVIVAESNQVTIYDGDDPDLPMWMVFNATNNSVVRNGGNVSSITVKNGLLTVGQLNGYGTSYGDFVADTTKHYGAGGFAYSYPVELSSRNVAHTYGSFDTSRTLVNSNVNDVAMTVLPNAPIDAATGLPVPTIAAATDGGISVIKDDGTVVDITSSNSSFNICHSITLNESGRLSFVNGYSLGGNSWVYVFNSLPSADNVITINTKTGSTQDADAFYDARGSSVVYEDLVLIGGQDDINAITESSVGVTAGLTLLDENTTTPANGMVAYTASDYATGWMNGDIKLATLSDTDDTDVTGAELVTNGTFDSNTSGWNLAGTGASFAVLSGQAVLTRNGTSATVSQYITTEVGKTYTVSVDFIAATGGANFYMTFDTLAGTPITSTTGTYSVTGTATSTSHYVKIHLYNTTSGTLTFDNISVRLAEEDRSVNGNGLQVFGTVTKNPVATGADLVAYSGFTTSNYLEQPYNSNMDMFKSATGTFAIYGWVKRNGSSTGADVMFSTGEPGTAGKARSIAMRSDNKFGFYGWTALYDSTATQVTPDGVWTQFCYIYTNQRQHWYINGQFDSVHTKPLLAYTANAPLKFGDIITTNTTSRPFNGSTALWRISATVPSPEQIAKIYRDEAPLFQENAQATLYGSSDAVTALAHDDSTDLLHVGTDNGRSVFQGLRRVDNTTDAVGAAISASNGLVAED